VGEEAERLRRIVEDLLLLARADSGRLPFEKEEVRLDVLAREVVESFGPRALEAGLRVEAAAESEVVVLGDERWLRQLVQNLVENAVRFSPARGSGKPPALVAIGVRADGEDALLIVEDEGPGIPEAERDRIFERFYRVDASRQRGAGTGAGLGLAICSWIVDAHRGRIDASGRADGGTAFRVRLPRA
jgi:signal transduction histidine kinase